MILSILWEIMILLKNFMKVIEQHKNFAEVLIELADEYYQKIIESEVI